VNVKEYISSGVVESYVLGLATEQEKAEFEKYCAQYPEVREARNAFEQLLEQKAIENAVAPAKDLKANIWSTIQADANISSTPATLTPVRKINWLKYAVAASIILLAGSVYWNYSLYTKNNALTNERDGYAVRIAEYEDQMKAMEPKPSVKMASMKGTADAPNAMTTVYWDTTSHDVYILVNNLPKPASTQQYQIWALLDGQPIDLGLIENEHFVKQNRLLVKAKNVQNAQAFAITLESLGGNPTPKGKMIVLGNL
jgi:anti-sigma-K factor RskA